MLRGGLPLIVFVEGEPCGSPFSFPPALALDGSRRLGIV